jgi:hypothetical protein
MPFDAVQAAQSFLKFFSPEGPRPQTGELTFAQVFVFCAAEQVERKYEFCTLLRQAAQMVANLVRPPAELTEITGVVTEQDVLRSLEVQYVGPLMRYAILFVNKSPSRRSEMKFLLCIG